MTYPPQPGHWKPSAPPPGSPAPGYYPPHGWSPPTPPQKQGGGLKWLLISVVGLLVIAVTIGATLFFTRSGPASDDKNAQRASDVASANDFGPVAIITSDPTCEAWRPIQTTLANALSNGWENRDPTSESLSWTPQVRAQYEAAGAAMRGAADQAIVLAKQTPHRVMHEMYEQFIAYGRAYADSLSSYKSIDNELSMVNVDLTRSIAGVCDAMDYGGVSARAPLVPQAKGPTNLSSIGSVGEPDRFVSMPISSCSAWASADSTLRSRLGEWEKLDASTPASGWTPEQRGVANDVASRFDAHATTMEKLGQQEGGTFEDFAILAALYLRAYAAAIPSYAAQDSWVYTPGLSLSGAVNSACKAVA